MPDLIHLISKWWKQIASLVILAVIAASIVVFMLPRKYLSVSTALPASSYLTDKSGVFGENVQQLYSAIGVPDDLDKIIGTAQLDTVYIAIAQDLDLLKHYELNSPSDEQTSKAAHILKLNTRVLKSDYNELKVKVWDTDKEMAARLANAIMGKLNSIHQAVQNQSNVAILENLRLGRQKMIAEMDSLSNAIVYDSTNALIRSTILTEGTRQSRAIARNLRVQQLTQYEKLINEYELVAESKPNVLVIVENARPSSKPDKPKRVEIIIAIFFLSCLFALLVALLLEKRNLSQND